MPGDWTLGCVLGRFDLAQGFDVASAAISANSGSSVVNSWMKMNNQSSLSYSATGVHSSAQGLLVFTNSTAADANVMRYQFGQANDAHERWFPDVVTHNIRLNAWARQDAAVTSGSRRFTILGSGGSANALIPFHASVLQPLVSVLDGITSGGGYPHLAFVRHTVPGSETQTYFDDIVAQTDWITLNPDQAFTDKSRLYGSYEGTLGGARIANRRGQSFTWDVPISYVPDSHAALIEWWYRNQFALAFTLDTSDANTLQLVRLTNEDNPIRKRMRPYSTLWEGTLQLESLHDGRLVF